VIGETLCEPTVWFGVASECEAGGAEVRASSL